MQASHRSALFEPAAIIRAEVATKAMQGFGVDDEALPLIVLSLPPSLVSLDLGANDPSNPSDNRFIGVEWASGIRTVQLQFDPASTAFQIDQIQFDLPAAECQTGQPDFNGDGWNDLVV